MQRVECNEFPISQFPYLSGEMFSGEMLGAGYLRAEISFRNAIIRKNGRPHSSFRKTWSAGAACSEKFRICARRFQKF